MLHRDVFIGGDGESPATESFAIGFVEEFDEGQVAHRLPGEAQEQGRCLSTLGFIE